MKRLLVLASMALIGWACSAVAMAATVVDQQYLAENSFGGLEVTANAAVAQTFTVGQSGTLVKVELPEFKQHRCIATDPVNIQLQSTVSGLPSGEVLAEVSIDPSQVGGVFGPAVPLTADLTSAHVDVSQGQVLAIVASTSAPGGGCTYAWNGALPGTYADGETIINGAANSVRDLSFRTYVQVVPTPYLYFSLDGNGREGTSAQLELEPLGSPTYVSAMNPGLGSALSVNGVDQALVGGGYVPSTTGAISLSAWVRADSLTGFGSIFKNWDGQFHFGLEYAPGLLSNYIELQGASAQPVVKSPGILPVGAWTHVGVVVDSATHEQRLYINGARVATATFSGVLKTDGCPGLGIGVKPSCFGNDEAIGNVPGFWHGQIDEVAAWTSPLSDAQMAALFTLGQSGVPLMPPAAADVTPPTITPSVSGTLGGGGWFTSNVDVSWTVSDPDSAVFQQSGCGPVSVMMDTSGSLLTCMATSSGGTAQSSVVIKRDTNPPFTVMATVSPPANSNGWNNTDVTVSFSGADNPGESGIGPCTPDIIFTLDVMDQSANGICTDVAGNPSAYVSATGINIDKVLPTVTIQSPQNGASYAVGTAFTATYSCSDAASGISACAGTVDSGSPFDAQTVGSKTFAVSTTDLAGNSATVYSTYTVTNGSTPLFAAFPTTLTFAEQALNVASAAQTIGVTNTGTLALPITGVTRSGTNANQFSQTNNCGSVVPAGGTCVINVVFKPSSVGAKSANLIIAAGGGAGTRSIPLLGVGSAADYLLVFTPTGLAFGDQAVNVASAPLIAWVYNNGSVPVPITGINRTGTNANQFSLVNHCGSVVPVLGVCTISVVFNPTSAGAKVADLNVKAGGGAGNKSATLTGTGIIPVFTLTPSAITFDDQAVGHASAAQIIDLDNMGTLPLPISSISDNGTNANQFTESSDCGAVVPVGGACQIFVVFSPTSTGTKVASVNVKAGASAGTQSVAVSGTAIVPSYSLSVTSLVFPDQATGLASAPQTVTLVNTGTLALPVTSVTRAGTNANQFSVSHDCGTSVLAGTSCLITVTFAPTSVGTKVATISVNGGGGAGSKSVDVSGNSVVGTFSVAPTALGFGGQLRNTSSAARTVTLTNTSASIQFQVGSISLGGANPGQFSQTNTCGAALAPGAVCTISVVFRPTSTGAKSATIGVTGKGGGATQSIALSGAGT
jgi:hypothetical protein